MSDFHIVKATEADIPDILRLITELAVYEKEPDAVKATPELLKSNIFEKGFANCILAKEGSESNPGETLGMALYCFNFSTWLGKPGLWLEDLYVTPKRRNSGIGKVLFGHLGRIAKENDCGRIEWCVLKWNTPSIGFYEKSLGARALVEWDTMRLEGDAEIDNLAKFLQ